MAVQWYLRTTSLRSCNAYTGVLDADLQGTCLLNQLGHLAVPSFLQFEQVRKCSGGLLAYRLFV